MTKDLSQTLADAVAGQMIGEEEDVCRSYQPKDNTSGKCGLRDYDVTLKMCKHPQSCPVRLNIALGALM